LTCVQEKKENYLLLNIVIVVVVFVFTGDIKKRAREMGAKEEKFN
jgi:hypothetical protein